MKEQTRAVLPRLCVLAGLLIFGALSFILVELCPDGAVVRLLALTHKPIDAPKIFGAYHISMLAVCLAVCAIFVILGIKSKKSDLDSVVFAFGIFFFFLELYKQLYYHAIIGNGQYNFGILPLQFCSYCLYLCLLIPILPEGRIKNALYSFTALYQTMGGCIVMAYPLFYRYLSLTVHTMIWHIAMIALGFLILTRRGYGRKYLAELVPPTLLFLSVFALATALNILLTPYTENSLQPLNLFYMSPYQPCKYFIIGDVRDRFGWFASLLCYASLFIFLGANTLWLTGRLLGLLRKSKINNLR